MTVTQFISSNNLQPADAIELVCPQAGFPKHYAVYLGYRNGLPEFVANITDGVRILSDQKLAEFVQRYQVTNIERFPGNHQQRLSAIKRAFVRLGEKAYSLVFNNCEHFKNWVLHGEGSSKQVLSFGTGAAITGTGMYLLGTSAGSRGLKRTGAIILIVVLIIIILAFVLWQHKRNNKESYE